MKCISLSFLLIACTALAVNYRVASRSDTGMDTTPGGNIERMNEGAYTSCVMWLTFNKSTTDYGLAVTPDLSGKGNNGAVIGGPTWSAGYYSFDGSDDRISTGTNSADLQTAFTVAAWYRKTGADSDGCIIGRFRTGFQGYMLWKQLGQATIQLYINSGSRVTTGTLSTNTWYHIAGTWDGSQVCMYVNGALVASNNYATAPDCIGGLCYIGYYGGQCLRADVDDAPLFNRALSAAEITNLVATTPH